jgi:3alpha(or 20beta)-hydroxysteroid dehydrogenase
MGRLAGKIALITGAAQGQGAAGARALSREGAFVYLADVVDGRSVAKEIGAEAEFLELDVSDPAAWSAAGDRVRERHGRLDVLVNNAGVKGPVKPFMEMEIEDFHKVFAINAVAHFIGVKTFAPLMPPGSSVVNITSVNGWVGNARLLPYVASKFAARGISRTLAIELAPQEIRVNSILPGAIDSPMVDPNLIGNDPRPRLAARSPMGRIGRVDEVAGMIVFLASDEASYCNGADYIIDGAWCA